MTEAAHGRIVGEVYTTELMGDHTLVTCRAGGATMIVKAAKTFSHRIGEVIGVEGCGGALVRQSYGDRIG